MGRLAAVVLAGGKGTRMKSETPKVLFTVAGKPMLQHVVDNLKAAGVKDVYIVIGHGAEEVKKHIAGDVTWVLQPQQLGTGDALARVAPILSGYCGTVLVTCGDTPLLTASTLSKLASAHMAEQSAVTVLTAQVPDPTGYGRIIRGVNGKLEAIVEHKDATAEQQKIDEVNSGTYCFDWQLAVETIAQIAPDNVQGEYYLTDAVKLLVAGGKRVNGWMVEDYQEIVGVNDRSQLAWAEGIMRQRINRSLMISGVTIVDPGSTWIDADVKVGRDTIIYPNTIMRGATEIGEKCVIGPGADLADCQLGKGVLFRYSLAESCTIGDGTTVGPFAYLRPGTKIGSQARIGDFVELKNSWVGDGAKVPHLAYVGDAIVGAGANIGCGAITANYDGKNKNVTEIGAGAFIGSNVNLVAPIKIGDGAYVAAGSTVTDDVPAKALAIARCRQTVKEDWRKE